MDVIEQFFIQKYDHEHKLILEQMPGENNHLFTLWHTIMSPSQPALVFDSAVMLQSCSCHVTEYMVLSKLVCITFVVP